MTEYIFIILAVVCFAAQFAFTKLYEKTSGQTSVATLVMLVGTGAVGALIFLCASGFKLSFSPISIFWAVVFAVIMIPYYMIGIKVLSLGSVAVYSMFMMLGGMLVPFFYGIIFLGEGISIGKIAGTVMLTAFIILQATGQKTPDGVENKKSKGKYLFFILCMIIFFINGMTGVIAKAHSISAGAVDEMSFTVMYCSLTSIISLVLLICSVAKNGKENLKTVKLALKPRSLLIMALLGAAAYGGNFLQLLAADAVPASVQFPLVSGGVIVLSSLVSALIFRERVSAREWISVAGAFASTFLFAF